MNSLISYFEDINRFCDKDHHSSDDKYEIYHDLISFVHFSSLKLNEFKSKLLTYINNSDELLSKVFIIIENRILWCINPKETDEFENITKICEFKSKVSNFSLEVLDLYKDYNKRYVKLSEIMNKINKIKLQDIDKIDYYEIVKSYNKIIRDIIILEDEFNSLDKKFEALLKEIVKEYEVYCERILTYQSVLYNFHRIKVKNISYSDLSLSF